VANELVEAVSANGYFRYWRALAYDRTGKFSQAMAEFFGSSFLCSSISFANRSSTSLLHLVRDLASSAR